MTNHTPAAARPDELPAITPTTYHGPPRPGISPLRLRVLVVDDNRDAADTLAGLLMLAGAEVRVCYDGATGAAAAAEFAPDVGLFDVNMAGMDGCALARAVRAGAGGRPLLLVAVTGVSDAAAKARTSAAGFDLHLTKPAAPRELVATLSNFDLRLRAERGGPGG
jgi:two-component system OmpR family response regulator